MSKYEISKKHVLPEPTSIHGGALKVIQNYVCIGQTQQLTRNSLGGNEVKKTMQLGPNPSTYVDIFFDIASGSSSGQAISALKITTTELNELLSGDYVSEYLRIKWRSQAR